MPLRIIVNQAVSGDQQVTTEIVQWNPVTGKIEHTPQEMDVLLQQALQNTDLRFVEMNMRHLEARQLLNFVSPEHRQKLLALLDVLAGKIKAEVLFSRWQSEIEENEELEFGRYAALDGCDDNVPQT